MLKTSSGPIKPCEGIDMGIVVFFRMFENHILLKLGLDARIEHFDLGIRFQTEFTPSGQFLRSRTLCPGQKSREFNILLAQNECIV